MKKFAFGALLFGGGLFGVILLIVAAVFNPAQYNDITGMMGSMLVYDTWLWFLFFIGMGVCGLSICIWQAFFSK